MEEVTAELPRLQFIFTRKFRPGHRVTQMHYARRGEITPEMEFIALREEIDPEKVQAEAALDGLYVVRTSLPQETLDAAQTVLSYKLLGSVERAFRSFKTMDLNVRPIHHRLAQRVRAHIFLCLLAYYVLWHLLEAWRPLLFADEDLEAKRTRDPVAPARRSQEALRKVHSRTLEDGTEVHSFQTLLKFLSSITRNLCRVRSAGPEAPTFELLTTPSAKQQRAFDLLETIRV